VWSATWQLIIRNDRSEIIVKTPLAHVAQLSIGGPHRDCIALITGSPTGTAFLGHVVSVPARKLVEKTYQAIGSGAACLIYRHTVLMFSRCLRLFSFCSQWRRKADTPIEQYIPSRTA
jgi:hypothetical protein